MSDRDDQATDEAPETGDPQQDTADGDVFKSGESKSRVLADLKGERSRRQQLESELEQYRQAAEERRQADMSEQERALEQARTEAADAARAEVREKLADRLFVSEVRAAAAGRVTDPELLADPTVARRLLGLDEVPLTDSGDIDAEVISAALGRLVEQRPYLAPGETPRAPQIDTGQGRRVSAPPAEMDPVKLAAQISRGW